MLRLVALVGLFTAAAALASGGLPPASEPAPPCPQPLPPFANPPEAWHGGPARTRLGDQPLPPFVWYRGEDLRPGLLVQCGLRGPDGNCSHNIGMQTTGGTHWFASRASDCALLADPPFPLLIGLENWVLHGWWSWVGPPPP